MVLILYSSPLAHDGLLYASRFTHSRGFVAWETNFTQELVTEAQSSSANAFTVAQLGFLLFSSAHSLTSVRRQTLALHGTAQHLRLQGITSATSRRTAVSWAAGTVDKESRLSKHSKVDHASNHLQFALRPNINCGFALRRQSAIALQISAANQKTLTTVVLTSFLPDQSRH